MFDLLVIAFVSFITAACIVNSLTPFLIERMKKRNITGTDLNKYNKPQVPEMGGISVFFGVFGGIFVAMIAIAYLDVHGFSLMFLFSATLTVLIVGFIGIFDDLIGWKNGIRKWQHALLPIIAALPLMVFTKTIPIETITLPIFGEISVGLIYPFVLVPLAVTGASNAINMLAGFNGLEAGLGSIIASTMLLGLFFLPDGQPGKIEAIILSASLLGALLAFLMFNWFPAKIFGGDSLTLMIGASIASVSIIAGLERFGVLLFAIYFVELAIKSKHKMQSECFGIPQKDGTLKPNPQGGSITHFIMRHGKFNEKQVVLIILGAQAIVSAIALSLIYFKII